MIRLTFPLAVLIALTASAVAQAPAEPSMEIRVSGGSDGVATVTGKVTLPAGWKLSIHTLNVRFQKTGSTASLNAFGPVKDGNVEFALEINLKEGTYKVWGLIDVKDSRNREKQIVSPAQSVTIQ
jgi:hypothetical protein